MKRRLILTFLIICLIFTAFSCSKAPENIAEEKNPENITEQNNSENAQKDDFCIVTLPTTLESCVYNCTDLFTATVIASENLPKETPLSHKNILISDSVLYTVEVKNAIRDFSVTENTKVHVARFVREADEQSEKYFLPFEIGKTYLICGIVQVLNNELFILDNSDFSVELKDDGSLVPLSLKSSELFKDIKTYDELLQSEEIKNGLDNYDICLPNQFYPLLKTEPSWLKWDGSDTSGPRDKYAVVLSEKEEVQKLIKEAMPIDSKKTIDIKTATYEELLDLYINKNPIYNKDPNVDF